MDITLTQSHQESGHFIKANSLKVKAVYIPYVGGETFSLRFLEQSLPKTFQLKEIYSPRQAENLKAAVDNKTGLVAICGPTGSGKTSTAYALLQLLTEKQDKIIFAIEDHPEHSLPKGVAGIKLGSDYTAARALRAALKTRPDVLLVGEIRNPEVSKLVVSAASECLIITTMQCMHNQFNLQLVKMGIPQYRLDAIDIHVFSQRLLRKLCPNCKQTAKNPKPWKRQLSVWLTNGQKSLEEILASSNKEYGFETPKELHVFEAFEEGCSQCTKGYKGRLPVLDYCHNSVLQPKDSTKTNALYLLSKGEVSMEEIQKRL